MKTFKLTALASLMLASGLVLAAAPDGRKTYIVQLKDEPAVSVPGAMVRVAPTRGAAAVSRFVYGSAAVQAYAGQLRQQQNEVAVSAGKVQVLHNYDTVFNGFSARLNATELAAIRANSKVASVVEDEARKMDTISTPKFLGLTAPGGLWSQAVGGFANKGEDMVVGVVDGGVWPENPAFADRVDGAGKPVFSGGTQAFGAAPASFTGSCMAGEGFAPASHCNNKLVGAKFYNSGFVSSGQTLHWSDFVSPRDSVSGATAHGGHGDHTASTAAGNTGATAIVNGLALGDASGMAPRARIATYKVCWTYVNPAATDGSGSTNSCYTSDSVKAIDDAVKDGVNSINYSISGSQTSVNDPVEQAFYRAAVAGVFVAASAGNSGPANQVAHISPWLTTVAASTHDRAFSATATLGNGVSYTGASVNNMAVSAKQLVLSTAVKAATASTSDANLCLLNSGGAPTLDPALTAGKVVVCTRGTNARVEKSLTVLNAGGVGMILADNGAGLVAEAHSVPTVHVSSANGTAIKSYVTSAGAAATASIGTFFVGVGTAPIMAGFSSRGPNQGDANVLKPDLTAPGVDVIAQVTPDLTQAQRDAVVAGTLVPPAAWASYQGTSMSSPHVAGLSLLLKQAHPSWSPAAIKSALMTTGYTTLNDGLAGAQNGLLPWAQGAGHVNPNKATDPGLVYDSGKADWVAYQCKVNRAAMTTADCTTFGTLDETYNLNLPSITVGTVVVNAVVKRRVTNVGAATATYNASVSVPGFNASVSPSSLTLAPGETKDFTVTLTNAGAVENVWNFGSLTWTDGTHVVRSPVQARAGKALSAPALVTSTAPSGTSLFTVKTGFAGRMGSAKGGLKDVTLAPEVSLTPGTASQATLTTYCNTGVDRANLKVYRFTVAAGTLVARFALRDADVGASGVDDFDMLVRKPDGTAIYSGNDGSNESAQIDSPAAGEYRVCVLAYGGSASMRHRLSSWVVTPSDTGGNFRAMLPGSVYVGGTATVGLAWSGLAMGGRYLGGVQLKDPNGVVQATTVVRVETNGGLPLLAQPENSASKTQN